MSKEAQFSIGSVVKARGRDWIVVPSEWHNLIKLRPLSGYEFQNCGILKPFIDNGIERIEPSNFPIPVINCVSDKEAANLLFNSARLLLRNSAGPFRSFGRISLKPRPYQLVPLLLALKQESVRLLIADDVGVGKTIEAGLIARELLDRGEIERICVLCPPHLVEQWHKELQSKFNINAEIIRSGTISKLEKHLPPGGDQSVFGFYRHIIVSLDFAKTDKRKANFLQHCPNFVIVDEAHTCSKPKSSKNQQYRHELVKDLAKNQDKQILFLTATPHSGVEEAFQSLLEFLKPEFGNLNLDTLTEENRIEIAKYFVQRRRADVIKWVGNDIPFPEREPDENSYTLGTEYISLFDKVYEFARGLIETSESLSKVQQRGRYWSALAIIRAVMSSPKAAMQTLSRQIEKRSINIAEEINEELFQGQVYDPLEDEKYSDVSPSLASSELADSLDSSEIRQLKNFESLANIITPEKDNKLQKLLEIVDKHLKEDHNPIVFCRYISTAEYVAKELDNRFKKVRIVSITGNNSEDERDILLSELKESPKRILVATDCLSEGMNLQDGFSSVIHYDLPWNPNRLEQREGRIDRYGQVKSKIKTSIMYGVNNPVDGAVLQVLIKKAISIHKSLGVTVPLPVQSDEVAEALFQSLFRMKKPSNDPVQLKLQLEEQPLINSIDKIWNNAVEKESRTRFAQRAIKPEEATKVLEESDTVLGSDNDVETFVNSVLKRLECKIEKKNELYSFPQLPNFLNYEEVGIKKDKFYTFNSTVIAENIEYIGRNHKFVEMLSQYALNEALQGESYKFSRCGVIRTDQVDIRTTLILYRIRYLISSRKEQDLLAEECFVTGFTGRPGEETFSGLNEDDAKNLLNNAPSIENLSGEEKERQIQRSLEQISSFDNELQEVIKTRINKLEEAHKKIRSTIKLGQVKIEAKLPLDIIGLYVLVPNPKGVN